MERLIRYNQRGCTVAIPVEVRDALKLGQGDFLEFRINRNGTVTIRKSEPKQEEKEA